MEQNYIKNTNDLIKFIYENTGRRPVGLKVQNESESWDKQTVLLKFEDGEIWSIIFEEISKYDIMQNEKYLGKTVILELTKRYTPLVCVKVIDKFYL